MPDQKSDEQFIPSLYLNPGTTQRPKKSISGCKCILLTITFLVLSGIGLFFFFLLEGFVGSLTQPHHAMYEKDIPPGPSAVEPLISRENTFDIAATVWMRKTETMGHADVFEMEKAISRMKAFPGGFESIDNDDQRVDLDNELEMPIFSDIVFRNLHLTDKYVFSTVNFTLPTAVFRAANLSNMDLRGSFVLIPSSSSFDRITNYSSWLPDEIKPFSTRSWPFPLGSDPTEKSLADKAIESLGISIPLLSFHGVHTRCSGDSNDSDPLPLEDDDDETAVQSSSDNARDRTPLKTTNGRPLETHPYVITRTQIHVVDHVNIFNRREYMKAHRELKATACGKSIWGHRPSRYLCERGYKTHGHWMTPMQLSSEQPSGKVKTQWVYSPYMAASRAAVGPKDLVMIPVNRENCTNPGADSAVSSSGISPEQDSINISWKLSYSGRSPIKHIFSAYTQDQILYDFHKSDYDRTLLQDTTELMFGLSGHRFSEKSHPRRRAFLLAIGFVVSISIILLEIRYWYSRRSTVGISILGSALVAGVEIFLEVASTIAQGRLDQLSISGWIATLLFKLATLLVLPLLMFKAIARIEFSWWKDTTWIPVIQRARATHQERASERLEAKMTWSTRIGLITFLVALYSIISPHTRFIVPSILPQPAPGDFVPDRLAEFSPYFVYPLYITGKIMQLTLNYYSKSYAGSYKLTAVLLLIQNLSLRASFIPSLVGRYDARPGLSLHEVVESGLLAVIAWHALTLPAVSHTEGEDHTE